MTQLKKFFYHLITLILLVAMNASGAKEYHSPHTSAPVNFHMTIIDDKASGSYGLIGQDITHNGYTDLVSFAYTGTNAGLPEGEIYWYEFQPSTNNKQAPTWKKHFITKKKHVVSGAFMDVDQDGFEDLIFMSDFEVPIKRPEKEGNIWWAKRPHNLNASEWETYWIGRTPGAHRIITADLQGTGHKQVVVVPLFGRGEKPFYGPAPITLYTPNENPKLPWKKKVFESKKFHVMHDAITVSKVDGKKGEDILIAAQEGVLKVSFYKNSSNKWMMDTTLLHASPHETAFDMSARDKGIEPRGKKQNANGNLSGITSLSQFDAKTSLLAAIDYTNKSSFLNDEPWHGDTVSIYQLNKEYKPSSLHTAFKRTVLEKRSAGGHAVKIADLRGKGCFDVIAGFRAYPTALVVYLCSMTKGPNGQLSTTYEKQIISERSANAIVLGNWSKNDLPDFATAGYGNEGDPYILLWSNRSKNQ